MKYHQRLTDFLQRAEQKFKTAGCSNAARPSSPPFPAGWIRWRCFICFTRLRSKHRWKITVAHFNHQLRGRASDADEQLVRKTAARLKLPFVVGRADVKQFAAQSKVSVEMAARKLRHDFFARAARKRKISTVALAHHADDQVELFFLRLLRGAGGEGLAGMKWRSPSPADTKITLVRPLLDFSKRNLRSSPVKTKSGSAMTRRIFPPTFCATGFATNCCRCCERNISPAWTRRFCG